MFLQGEVGPFQPQVPVEVPLWLAVNLKQRQKCRIITPDWMDVGETYKILKYLPSYLEIRALLHIYAYQHQLL